MSSSSDEDRIEKAIAFLLHPSVRGSTEEAKRSFLLKKGLTSDEIDEAFRRTDEGASKGADGGSSMSTSAAIPQSSPSDSTRAARMQHFVETQPRGYSYGNIMLGIGFAAAAVYSIRALFGPSISNTLESVKSSLKGRTRSASVDDNCDLDDTKMADGENSVTIVEIETDDGTCTNSNSRATTDSSKQLVEAIREQTEQLRLSMEQLIRSSTSGYESISELREEVRSLAGRLDGNAVNRLNGMNGTSTNRVASVSEMSGVEGIHGANERSMHEEESAPMSYMQVLEMLEQGQPIPGIRDDINDKPPNPGMSPTASRMQVPTKPWEKNNMNELDNVTGVTDNIGSSGTTPSRRDLSGNRHSNSIYESVTTTPERHQSVVVEQDGTDKTRNGRSPTPWRPPPLPMTSLSSSISFSE